MSTVFQISFFLWVATKDVAASDRQKTITPVLVEVLSSECDVIHFTTSQRSALTVRCACARICCVCVRACVCVCGTDHNRIIVGNKANTKCQDSHSQPSLLTPTPPPTDHNMCLALPGLPAGRSILTRATSSIATSPRS